MKKNKMKPSPIYELTHKDGSIQLVTLFYDSPDPNFWMGNHDKFLNRNNKPINDWLLNGGSYLPININKSIEKWLYGRLPDEEKMYYVSPIDNIPMRTERMTYVKGKYLKKQTLCRRIFNWLRESVKI